MSGLLPAIFYVETFRPFYPISNRSSSLTAGKGIRYKLASGHGSCGPIESEGTHAQPRHRSDDAALISLRCWSAAFCSGGWAGERGRFRIFPNLFFAA